MRLRPSLAACAAIAAMFVASCSPERATGPRPTILANGAPGSTTPLVISQVYGGGGNSGATLKNDFIEIFNPGPSSVSVAGWSVQYASAAGTSWAVTNLSGTIPAGGYQLIQEAAGTGGTVNLPTPDATGGIAMAAGSGKVVLVKSTVASTGTCPTLNVEDQVSYGTSTTCGFGNTALLTNTTAALRNGQGCTWTGVLGSDFATGAPAPRNSASSLNPCVVTPPPAVVASVTVSPNPVFIIQGAAPVTMMANAFDASSAPIGGVSFTWASDNTAAATVSAGGAVTGVAPGTAHVRATAPNGVFGEALVTVNPPAPPGTLPETRFSELHYDNTGTDAGEAIEIEGPAGTDLTGWTVLLYNGNGGLVYDTKTLSGPIPATCGGRGVVTVTYASNGIQNGAPDGMALVDAGGNVIEFLSYEGVFAAVDGAAAGLPSVDIVALQNSAPTGQSLQRDASNIWASAASSFGACNSTGSPPPPATGITVSLSMNLPRQIPAGFVKPVFPTVRNNGTVVAPTPALTWTSSNNTIATVDANGYVTALVPGGPILIRATEPVSGAFAETTVDVLATTVPTGAQYHTNTMFGIPTDADGSDDILISRPQYDLSYNAARGGPNWVAANINVTVFGAAPRCDCFSPDPLLPSTVYHVVDFDFRNGGYDRGHMTQSEPRTDTYQENATTFFLTNILPQGAENNQGPWSKLENYLNDLVRQSGKEVWVYSGGEYSATPPTLKNAGVVQIPDYTWKVAVVLNAGQTITDVLSPADLQVIAVVMPNLTTVGGPASSVGIRNNAWQMYQVTVDQIEAVIGYDLLNALPDAIERIVESNDKPPVSVAGGPYAGVEGTAIGFNGGASSDPDLGDVITYAWDFGDGATGTGATPTHAYADNSAFTATLTVTDSYGLSSSSTAPVNVSNASPVIASFSVATGPFSTGASVPASVTFTDAGSADTHTASFDWGDGVTTSASSHAYSSAGLYTVTVTITDDDGGSASQSSTSLVVVYDVAAGAVLGRGEISDGTGRANLTIQNELRYENGVIGRFTFTTSSLQLQARWPKHDWLVIPGGIAFVRGRGTITGRTGTFEYLLVIRDGGAGRANDGLRVKIWDSTGLVLFDNQPGQPDNSTQLSPVIDGLGYTIRSFAAASN